MNPSKSARVGAAMDGALRALGAGVAVCVGVAPSGTLDPARVLRVLGVAVSVLSTLLPPSCGRAWAGRPSWPGSEPEERGSDGRWIDGAALFGTNRGLVGFDGPAVPERAEFSAGEGTGD